MSKLRRVAKSVFSNIMKRRKTWVSNTEKKARKNKSQEKKTRIEFLYVVKRGGQADIELRVYDPLDKNLVTKLASKYDRFRENNLEKAGVYKICFNNGMSRWTSKIVGIDLLGSHRPQQAHYNHLAKQRHLGKMIDAVLNVADYVDEIEEYQEISRDMDDAFWSSVEANDSRYQYFTLIEVFLLFIINVWQIRSIRHWFRNTKKGWGI